VLSCNYEDVVAKGNGVAYDKYWAGLSLQMTGMRWDGFEGGGMGLRRQGWAWIGLIPMQFSSMVK